MTELLGARRLRALLDAHGIRPRRELGQNFVVDPNTIRKLVAVSGVGPDDVVLEIGAGAGSLTLGLADRARRVIAVEADPRLVGVLHEVVGDLPQVDIVAGDALRIDPGSFGASALVANLPYRIAATVVLRVLEQAPDIARLTVMVQREVAERLAAGPGDPAYGRTSVLVSYFARAEVAVGVARTAFFPVPEVDSAVARIVRVTPPPIPYEPLRDVVGAAFAQRRKTLRNSLGALFSSTAAAAAALEVAGIDPGERPERIGLDGFVALARRLGSGRAYPDRRGAAPAP